MAFLHSALATAKNALAAAEYSTEQLRAVVQNLTLAVANANHDNTSGGGGEAEFNVNRELHALVAMAWHEQDPESALFRLIGRSNVYTPAQQSEMMSMFLTNIQEYHLPLPASS